MLGIHIIVDVMTTNMVNKTIETKEDNIIKQKLR